MLLCGWHASAARPVKLKHNNQPGWDELLFLRAGWDVHVSEAAKHSRAGRVHHSKAFGSETFSPFQAIQPALIAGGSVCTCTSRSGNTG
jgi:hypothetical protein